ncbi:WG repeat-containing protein [Psychrobacter celer]
MFRCSLSKPRPVVSNLWTMMLRCTAGVGISIVSALLVIPQAQAASCKIPKSYYKNVSCTASSGLFLAVKDFGAPVALIDNKGKRIVDLSRYQKVDADNLSEGLLPVLRNGHVGYLNMKGREVVPAMYDILKERQGWARPVSEGRIVVKKDGNYGVINTANRTVVPFSSSFSEVADYRGGITRVRKSNNISWLDKSGNVAKDPADNNHKLPQARQSPSTPPISPFTTLQPRQQDGKWGFVDDQNVTMITYSFDEVRPFSEGMAGVRINKDWGFVNLGGELLIPFRFADSGVSASDTYQGKPSFVFVDGKAWIGNLKNGNKMCIDKTGSSVGCD